MILHLKFYAICKLFLFSTPVFAYIDPSVMTYTIQAIAGVVIAVGAVVGIVWRRARKKAKQILNVNENTKKEVEEEIQEISPNEKD